MSVRPCYFTTSPQLSLITPSNVKTSWENIKWSFLILMLETQLTLIINGMQIDVDVL